ncbi:hypothetical protein N7468_004160 [Penicillium chermesinum]|uniref:NACHT domain-containing protein n=1 Tax=Penicillium chermesinum TaxID=63820 RepID=A0A9W9TSB2_9EURO|nr:uncharacterized protein N7468_004160 [Penicillium chermesinum]KAJ5239541.1 hypothetical protein N7468_004160 [Penicillium chermesinum]
MFSMGPTSFGRANTGLQLGNNHGTIGTINISSDRPENPEKTDNELLRSLAFPQMLDRRDNIEARHTNTCEWILELDEYQSWRNQPCGLLWVKGKPGAGKSTLMVFLRDRLSELQDGGRGVLRLDFFFTARGVELQRTPLGMLRSLLNQIFVQEATIRPYVREIYDQRCRQFGFGERRWEWPQTVLEELLASAVLASATKQHVIIFVDALDEAGAKSAQQLAAYFHRLVDYADKKKLPLQVYISCRHYPITECPQTVAIHVEDHNKDDIATYIKDTLLQTDFGEVSSQGTRDVLVEELAQHAKGVFQWAHLIMPFIQQQIGEGESISDMRDWLCEVPADLEDVYTYVLSNVITARNRDQSFLFFQWVCLAERPLTIVEIRYALAAKDAQIKPPRTGWERLRGFVESNEHMKRRVKALSGGLAEVVLSGDDEETVQVVHQSVNDFLRTKGLSLLYISIKGGIGTQDMKNILSQSQGTLYRSCLVYLATICSDKQTSEFQRSRIELVRDRAFLEYATINLFIHAEKAADSRGALLENEKAILHQITSFWVQIYQCLDVHIITCPPSGTTILHMAAAANLLDLILSVLSGGEDIERRNEVGHTALHFAARVGNTRAGKILQEKGANREAETYYGATCLMEAIRGGKFGICGLAPR